MPADVAQFREGLLRPELPVPELVKGRSERRYAVYRNNVTVGLIRALEANFPVVRRLLGETYFAGFARDFAQNHPPSSPLMFNYGRDFPDALRGAEDLASYPYLADVARLEILWRDAYHAADENVMSPVMLQSLGEDELFSARFIPHPSARLLSSGFAVHSIFNANRAPFENATVDPQTPECVLVTRPQWDVMTWALTASQHVFFAELFADASLADATEKAYSSDEHFDLAATLTLVLQSGAFTTLHTGQGPHEHSQPH